MRYSHSTPLNNTITLNDNTNNFTNLNIESPTLPIKYLKGYKQPSQQQVQLQNIQKIRKIFEQQSKKNRCPIQKLKKDLLIQSNKSVENSHAKEFHNRKYKKELDAFVVKYKKSLPIDLTQSQIVKFQQDQKVKLFQNLAAAFFQIQEQHFPQPYEEQFHSINYVKAYGKIEKMCSQIDYAINKRLYDIESVICRKKYRNFYKEFNQNLAQAENKNLRSQVLCREIVPESLVYAREEDFYSESRKQKIRERQMRLLAQSEAPIKKYHQKEQQPEISYGYEDKRIEIEIIDDKQKGCGNFDKNTLRSLSQWLEGRYPKQIEHSYKVLLDCKEHQRYLHKFMSNLQEVFPGKAEDD